MLSNTSDSTGKQKRRTKPQHNHATDYTTSGRANRLSRHGKMICATDRPPSESAIYTYTVEDDVAHI